MAEMRKAEEGSAFPEKRKLDQPNSINKALEEEMEEIKEEDEFDSKKRQKLEIPAENEKYIITVAEKFVESKDGEDSYKGDENDNKDVHLKVESEIADKGKRIAAVDKGKAILIQESEEEGENEEEEDNGDNDDDEDYDYDSSDDSDSDFSDGLGGDSEYDLAN
ncbi:hypothetical protein CDL12_03035 [Handroanthus impetiginosus]|uniref:Uncharacterized protein n=1 Tax=Handroanthus impetiginosus TaxID=429701 RepID=A0A2G9I385_9LAMI|nr:hypothetical protein CDL12_03035 [Handroanthus impetiginosus]